MRTRGIIEAPPDLQLEMTQLKLLAMIVDRLDRIKSKLEETDDDRFAVALSSWIQAMRVRSAHSGAPWLASVDLRTETEEGYRFREVPLGWQLPGNLLARWALGGPRDSAASGESRALSTLAATERSSGPHRLRWSGAGLVAKAFRPFAVACFCLLAGGAVVVPFCAIGGFLLIGLGLLAGVFMCHTYRLITGVPFIADRILAAVSVAVVGWMATAIVAVATR